MAHDHVVDEAKATLTENKSLQKELMRLKQQLATSQGASLAEEAVDVGDVKGLQHVYFLWIVKRCEKADRLKNKLGRAVVVLGSVDDNDQVLLVAVYHLVAPMRLPRQRMKELAAQVGGRWST